MTEIEKLRAEMDRLKADPPRMDESPANTGRKLLAIADLTLRIAENLARR